MSTELLDRGPLLVTQFYGGADRGVCLQFTPTRTGDCAQLTRTEVEELARVVNAWLGGVQREDGPSAPSGPWRVFGNDPYGVRDKRGVRFSTYSEAEAIAVRDALNRVGVRVPEPRDPQK